MESIKMPKTSLLMTLIVGIAIGAIAVTYFLSNEPALAPNENNSKPLYWVAPMDDNYRRDKPGKSPMGMDLVPVYKEVEESSDSEGAVYIAPHVINNLGVRTDFVKRDNFSQEIQTVGYVQYDEDKLIHIHPRVDGWIEKLYIKAAGDPVEVGQPLYSLYSPELVSAQEEYLIALKRNNTTLINAAKARLHALQISKSVINELKQTQQVKQSIIFYAPQSGVLDGLEIREGFFVKPGNTLMSIGRLDQVWVEAEVFESDSGLVQNGDQVEMTLDFLPNKRWHGQVDYIYPSLNPKTRTLRVRLKFNNPEFTLKPNMFAAVKIMTQAKQASLLIPKEAVIRTGSQNRVVLSLGNGQFTSVPVDIGRVNLHYIEITSGLVEGDEVVVSAQFLIDSESSKNADFLRMKSLSDDKNLEQKVASATVTGVINSIDKQTRVINISRDAIAKWNRAEATMDFVAASNINLNSLNVEQAINFTFEVHDDFVIVAVTSAHDDHQMPSDIKEMH